MVQAIIPVFTVSNMSGVAVEACSVSPSDFLYLDKHISSSQVVVYIDRNNTRRAN